MRRQISLLTLIFVALPMHAQETHIIEQLEFILPAEYQVVLKHSEIENDVHLFTGPVNPKEIQAEIDRYEVQYTSEDYLNQILQNEAFGIDDFDPDEALANWKSLKIRLIKIVPDAEFAPDETVSFSAVPESQVGSPPMICDSFSRGFKRRWGGGAFHIYDPDTEICHSINLYGAVIALHVRRVGSYLVLIDAIDWPIANLQDHIADEFGQVLMEDFSSATDQEKFEAYQNVGNTSHARFVLSRVRQLE